MTLEKVKELLAEHLEMDAAEIMPSPPPFDTAAAR